MNAEDVKNYENLTDAEKDFVKAVLSSYNEEDWYGCNFSAIDVVGYSTKEALGFMGSLQKKGAYESNDGESYHDGYLVKKGKNDK